MKEYYHLKRTTDPATEPVTLTEAKVHLKVDHSDDDTLITALIVAAREMCEEYCQRSFITQTWTLYMRDFPDGVIQLPRGPVASVTSVKYSVSTEADTTLATANYSTGLNGNIGIIDPIDSWPSTDSDFVEGVQVVYVAGEATTKESVKIAVKILLSDWYENRQSHQSRNTFTVTEGGKPFYQTILDKYKIYAG